MQFKRCKLCKFVGQPVMPKVDFIEVLLWLVFIPMGFFYSFTRRAWSNRTKCPRCQNYSMKGV